jgi:TetR/AcrR family transcriptional repressor of nem operon
VPVSDPRPSSHRGALVDAMRRVALAKGFPATTVEEVCEMAGVTKGSFYHHFHGKDDPVLRLQAFVAHAGEVSTGPVMVYGCLIGSFALDLAESSPELRPRLSQMFVALRDVVAGLVAAAAAERGRELDAGRLGDQFLAVVEGSIVLAKAHADPSLPGRGLALFGEHLDLLLR